LTQRRSERRRRSGRSEDVRRRAPHGKEKFSEEENVFQRVLLGVVAALGVGFAASAEAEEVTVTINKITDQGVEPGADGKGMGTVLLTDSEHGLILKPNIKGLSPGAHGWHIHEKPDCAPAEQDGKAVAGGAAGSHLDPQGTGEHRGPSGEGHLGDLPRLYVPVDEGAVVNTVKNPVIAPRLKVADVRGRAIVIHAGGDNYLDEPKPLGGGGERVACGVVPNG
jgi:Cu-Zn family superoxide dismutase